MKKLLLLLGLIWMSQQQVRAQFSAADSAFLNGIFVENLYIGNSVYSNDWFTNPALDTITTLYQQIHSNYPFYDSMLLGAYAGIQFQGNARIDTPINQRISLYNLQHTDTLFGCFNPFVVLPFQLGGIQGKATALLDTNSNGLTVGDAFVVLTGSGDNQLTRMVVNDSDYHNLNCLVRNHLKTKGDVYIVGESNEDNRAIHFNKKKLGRYYPSIPTYLHNYLNNTHQSMGINRLIETIAWIKYLKTKYNRVYVLGLSSGGTEALWASLLAKPKGTLVASGYSVLFDTDSLFQTVNGYFYGNCMSYFKKDTVKKYINAGSTYYYFTQCYKDLPIFKQDSIGNVTRTYYTGNPKTTFVSNYYNHAFPPCSLIDTFLNHITTSVDDLSDVSTLVACSSFADQSIDVRFDTDNIKTVRVYDISGRLLADEKTTLRRLAVNCSGWAAGFYLVDVAIGGKHIQQKVVKH